MALDVYKRQNQPPLESDQYLQYQDHALNAMQPEAQLLVDAVKNANDAIYYVSQTQSQCAGMGTTLVLGLFINNRLLVGHIGDSRMYRLRGLEFIQLTEDHSILQEQLNAGLITAEQAKYSVKDVYKRQTLITPKQTKPTSSICFQK